MCQHGGRSQLYAWPHTSLDRGRCEDFFQLQPAYPQQLRQPEGHLHRNTLLGNRNTLHPRQFKVRRVRSSTIDPEELMTLWRYISTRDKNPSLHIRDHRCSAPTSKSLGTIPRWLNSFG